MPFHYVSLTPDELRFCCFNQDGRAQLQRGLAMKWAAAMRAWALVSRSLAFLIVLTECMFADHDRDGQLPTCVSRHTHAPPGAWQEILLIQLSYEMIPAGWLADLACAVPPVPLSPRQARFPFWDRHLPNWD